MLPNLELHGLGYEGGYGNVSTSVCSFFFLKISMCWKGPWRFISSYLSSNMHRTWVLDMGISRKMTSRSDFRDISDALPVFKVH